MQRKIFNEDNLKEAYRIWQDRKAKREGGYKLVKQKVFHLLKSIASKIPGLASEEPTKIADPEAVECIIGLLDKGLLIEEIAYLASEPASDNVQENNEERDLNTVQILTQEFQNPNIDQAEATRLRLEIAIGKDRAKRVMLDDQMDPNAVAIATRQQLLEFAAMMGGEPMPVASIDKHAVHRETLAKKIAPVMEAIANAPAAELLQGVVFCLDHYQAHIDQDVKLTEQARAQEQQAVDTLRQQLEENQSAMEQQAAATGLPPGSVPPGAEGQPLTPEQELATRQQDHAEAQTQADLAMRQQEMAHNQQMTERNQAMAEERHSADLDAQRIKQSQDSAQLVINEAQKTREAGIKEAALDRKSVPSK